MKFSSLLAALLVMSVAGCASSQTKRDEAIFCHDDYFFAVEDSMSRHQTGNDPAMKGLKSGSEESHIHRYLYKKLEDRRVLQKKTMSSEDEGADEKQKYIVLIMSGGGQNGAFGAGVLNGWSDRTEGIRRSEVDMITTISTGAMALTYALVGNYGHGDQIGQADDALREIYTTTPEDELLESKGLLSILTTNSLANTRGMGQRLDEAIDQFMPMISGWDEGNIRGRTAFVGTVNMDNGKFYTSDLLAVARQIKTDETARDCYREVILASAAEPVFFPPRFITSDVSDPEKSHMYVDGGLRFGVFWSENLRVLKSRNVAMEVYIIVNGDLAADPYICDESGDCYREQKTTGNKLLDIAKRSSTIATDQLYKGSLDRIYGNLLETFGPGNFKMKYTYIKPEFIRREKCRKSVSSFDPVYMSCLYRIGERVGETWDWHDFNHD
ncbi:hypothetical protein MNBD_ALPHA01-1817 [hydrothermal vent metagenome]|uniref:PNPLA domain-containing protein n=1 Tax=hydrothermal vent metagenome TaxID=652676 RepID=A0A3B0TJS3_9ZZZZ